MSSTKFSELYRRHVLPRLLNLTRAQAYLVQHNVETFSGAHQRIMAEAIRLGAAHLPLNMLLELREWVTDTLGHWIEQPPLEGSLGVEQARRLWQSLDHLADTDGDDEEEKGPSTEGE